MNLGAKANPGHWSLPPHRLSVVVPMFDEVDNVRPLVSEIESALIDYPFPWELIIVDDGSKDGTDRVLQALSGWERPYLRALSLARNYRQTVAMQAGIDAARGDVIVTMDGDLQNDARDIPRLVARLLREDLDLVAGWRVNRQDGFWLRRLPSQIANRLIRRVTGLAFHDLGCSLKVFRTSVLRRIRLHGEMHRFLVAWLATVTSPARIAEEPVHHRPRHAGQSKYGLSRIGRVLLDLLAVHFFLRFGSRPGHFFGGIGLTMGAVGGLLLTWLALLKLQGESIGNRPLLALGLFMMVAGVQLMTTGVLAEVLIRIRYDRGETRPYHLSVRSVTPAESAGWHEPPGHWHAQDLLASVARKGTTPRRPQSS